MLLEELEDGGAAPVEAPLRALHADARQLLSRLNTLLAPPTSGDVPEIGALLRQLVEPARAIATAADELNRDAAASGQTDLAADVDKIARAAGRFLELVGSG